MPGIERAPGGRERLVRLEHDREFGEIETADEHQRAGAELGGVGRGVREGVADLAQRHQLEAAAAGRAPAQMAC